MGPVDAERSFLAVVAVPLAALVVAGGTLTAAALAAGREPQRVGRLADAVPALVRAEETLAVERVDALAAATDAAARGRLPIDRSATDAAVSALVAASASLRSDVAPVGRAASALTRLPAAVQRARRAPGGGGADYAAASGLVQALPDAVADTLGDPALGRPVRSLTATLAADEAVLRVRLAGRGLLRPGAGRAEVERLAASRALLDDALAGLAAVAAAEGRTAPDASLLLRSGVVAGPAAAARGSARPVWDAAADRFTADLHTRARDLGAAAGRAAADRARAHTLQALAAVVGTLVVAGAAIAHALVSARSFAGRPTWFGRPAAWPSAPPAGPPVPAPGRSSVPAGAPAAGSVPAAVPAPGTPASPSPADPSGPAAGPLSEWPAEAAASGPADRATTAAASAEPAGVTDASARPASSGALPTFVQAPARIPRQRARRAGGWTRTPLGEDAAPLPSDARSGTESS